MENNTNTQEHEAVAARTNQDLINAGLIVSVVINLAVLVGWFVA